MSIPLALAPIAAPRTYQLTTTSLMRMNEAEEQNTYRTTARLSLLERKPNNTYRLAIEILGFEAENDTFFNALAADLNRVSNSLVVQTDVYGRLEQIENKADMLKTWQRMRSDVVKKYRQYYPEAFFDAFGHNIAVEGVFEKTLRHKGLHGVLLVGLYGYGYAPDAPVRGTRVLEQFINQVSLPLQTTTTVAADAAPGQLRLAVVGGAPTRRAAGRRPAPLVPCHGRQPLAEGTAAGNLPGAVPTRSRYRLAATGGAAPDGRNT